MSKQFKYLIALILALVASWILAPDRSGYTDIPPLSFSHDSLSAHIHIFGYPRKYSSPVGYHYELLDRYSKEKGGSFTYIDLPDTCNMWDALLNDSFDILVINRIRDSIPRSISQKLTLSPTTNAFGDVWITRKNDLLLMNDITHWLSHHKNSRDYNRLQTRFYTTQNNKTPYDSLIRESSRSIGMPWLLMASIMYQESKFRPNASSLRGAKGLMQIRDFIIRDFGGGNIFDPRDNLYAACSYISYLERNIGLAQVDSCERWKFILAAYNAGQGRLDICRDMADSTGMNRNLWMDVSSFLPEETQFYIMEVWDRYTEWAGSLPNSNTSGRANSGNNH